ncbi:MULTISPECIES: magnesium-translocating P-type ATPase [Streptomyces]|uniref:Magnesium-transporting ATPase, P-type 1 n=1 Tax=Streptomyces koelreuteriae TaxID=2838015 RepID=A0ABX8FMI3_9ACTN|nr:MULTISPECIES: magnesium-translocating P-type ATPase [Streptomyces]QWB22360.1 magnesium-translocating P-type ATPase [Streptomyces koelreuteriae]UUA05301.1 magnesium-translocating P-type ATPase [Streptomyces koelreuteriae]UUA12927.1 magnesium-translocating P-type ATPase [Streptomyces sp. CRCS-T-1]
MASEPAEGTTLEVLRRLESGPRGLTEAEAEARLIASGENTLPEVRTPSWPLRAVRALRDPFTAVLLCLGLVSVAIASWGTGVVILALVVVSCVLRATGEHRADRSMSALRELVAGTAAVLRRADGREPPEPREIPVAELVPGDVIRLGPGDLIPADVRLLRARGLTVHEAALTGESAPVAKRADGTGESLLCLQGSSVASGTATAVVVATGTGTRFAAAHRQPAARREGGAFDRSVHGISWVLIRFMLLTPPLVLMANAALRGRGLETLPFAVAVAVGLTPEMLPVIVTTCLARGAALLARTHGVIVKRLPALHDLGAVDVLCVDKTGTLTQDRPVVARSLDPAGRDDPEILRWAAVGAWWTLQLAELPAPDALDEALLEAAGPVGEEYDGVDAVPFDPVRRIATAVVRGSLGRHTVVVTGAVEAVLERCATEPGERDRLLALAAREADTGLRVLALATADRPAAASPPTDPRGLAFRGLVTFRDALAPTAAEALRGLADRGVTVKVLTGDHPATAARACRELGLDLGRVRTAADLTDAEAAGTTVVARCTPQDKARLVAALRAAGHTVGFLGDGVNDVAALRTADVSLAPRCAVGVARESADVVLAEKDLTAIGHAVTAGRHASGNIASYLRVTLSSNLGNVVAMLAAGLLLPFLPMLPAQVLAQNLCFDAAQLAFAHDRPGAAALRGPAVLRPRSFLRFVTGFGLLNALADLATFAVLALALDGPDAVDDEAVFHSAWFTENLLTQALVMLLLRSGRGVEGSRVPGPVGLAAAGLAAVGLLLPPSPLGSALGMTVLPAAYYLLPAVVLGLYALALTAARARLRRRQP